MDRPQSKTSHNVKMVGIKLQLTRALWSTGKVVMMYIGICVLKVLLETSKRGVYGSALIKKRRYWYKGVHRYSMNGYFRSKNICDVGFLRGK